MIEILANIFYVCGFALALSAMHMPNRRLMLTCCMTYSFLYVICFLLQGELAGALSCLIASCIILINAFVPDEKLDETFKMRLVAVGIFCIGAAFVCVKDTADLLPFMGLILARFSETLNTQQKIRIGYACSAFLWLNYIISTGNVLLIALEATRWSNILFTIYLHERKKAKVPAYAVAHVEPTK